MKQTDERKRTTIADVARAAGVSRTTVSYVLSGRQDARVPETTRRRIVDAAERIGYRRNALAVAFRSGRMNTVGIVAPISPDVGVGNVYYKDLVLAVAAAAFEAGLNPLLLSENRSHALTLAEVADRRADGVILVVKERVSDFVNAANDAGVPCVTVGRDVGAWQIHTDNVVGGRLAAEHLLSLGHRRLAYLAWHLDGIPSVEGRRQGFEAALRDAGIDPVTAPQLRTKDEAELTDLLRRSDGPTAICCYNDEVAVHLLDRCRELGLRVPEDISLVGFDDNILAVSARPRLTTIHSPLDGLATQAVALIQAQLRNEPPPPAPILVAPHLVVRETTAPPRDG
jgi:LacI family transcriptional regulator